MLAMCVRKTTDTGGTPTMQGSSLTSSTGSTAKTSRRHKPLKAVRSRGGAVAPVSSTSSAKQQETSDKRTSATTTLEVDCTVKVRDDPTGHLIYHKGDKIDQRCKSAMHDISKNMLELRVSAVAGYESYLWVPYSFPPGYNYPVAISRKFLGFVHAQCINELIYFLIFETGAIIVASYLSNPYSFGAGHNTELIFLITCYQ